MRFQQDHDIEQIAVAYAADAVEFSGRHYDTLLDYSDQSIQWVEKMLADLHDDIPKSKPSEEEIFRITKLFGSYIGEVYRKNHGAVWGMIFLENDSFPGMRADKNHSLFWPWGKTYHRLKNGDEDNVFVYYKRLL